jgi:hypothetical protein
LLSSHLPQNYVIEVSVFALGRSVGSRDAAIGVAAACAGYQVEVIHGLEYS